MKQIRMFVVGLALAVLLVFGMAANTVVNRIADYREMTAPKNLHQMAMETREGPDSRNGLLLAGAGLFAVVLLGGGGLLFAATSGSAYGRSVGRRRKRARKPAQPAAPAGLPAVPRMRVLPPAEVRRALPAAVAEEGHYEDL